jgi:hypothetical protein
MIFGIFVAMAIALWFGVPVLPLLFISANTQLCVAYFLSKNTVCINMGAGVWIVSAAQFLILPTILNNTNVSFPIPTAIFTILAYAVSCIGLIGGTVIGLMGNQSNEPSKEN